jgi:hypothetical protein
MKHYNKDLNDSWCYVKRLEWKGNAYRIGPEDLGQSGAREIMLQEKIMQNM